MYDYMWYDWYGGDMGWNSEEWNEEWDEEWDNEDYDYDEGYDENLWGTDSD